MTTEFDKAAREALNAGHALVTAVEAALSPTDREKWRMFTTAGASTALTIRWVNPELVEVRVGVVPDDSEALPILVLDFRPTANSH